MRHRLLAGIGVVSLALALLAVWVPGAQSADPPVLSPSAPAFSYDHDPVTSVNIGGLAIGSCFQPESCDHTEFTVDIPAGYYESLRAQGKVGVVQIAVSWEDNANDFDLGLLDKDDNPIASSGFGNSDFERINYTELASGTYTIEIVYFRAANVGFHVDVRLLSQEPTPSAATPDNGGMAFDGTTPVALERSSGEPNMSIAPDGAIFIDIPLGAGTNSILYKSTDNGVTYRPLAPYHPNNNPLPNNVIGGGDSYTSIDKDGRICFSELNTLVSLGIGCSTDGGKTFVPADPLVLDPTTPLVDRQWQASTPQNEQFIAAQFGILTVGPSMPGIRLYKETPKGSNAFVKTADIDTGKAMKSYNMAVDPTDTDADGGTVVEAYLRSNEDAGTKAASPHELMVWQTTDGGTAVTTHKVADLPTTPGNNFASVAVDKAGNTYVAWSEQGTWDIFYSVAKKGDLDHWSTPVRVNADPDARTAIQPTIKVGDAGRVFIGFYGAPQWGNPDALPDGAWNAFLSYSLDGACQLDASPCDAPTFKQARITDHPAQYRGICLGGTGCGGDPYYGDRSMLEFLDIEFSPDTGQVHVVTTDSSRVNPSDSSASPTTISTHTQISGPSAFAGKPDIAAAASTGALAASASAGTAATGAAARGPFTTDAVSDPSGDAEWPYESPTPAQKAPGADIVGVSLTRPDSATLQVTMKMADVGAFQQALLAGLGQELLVATRFATAKDVFFVGMKYRAGGSPSFGGGHLTPDLLVDLYAFEDGVHVTGTVDAATNSIVMKVPLADLKTTEERPEGVDRPVVAGVANSQPLYAVTGFSLVGVLSSDDSTAKHWLDIAPALTFAAASNNSTVPPGGGGGGGAGGGGLPATGSTGSLPDWGALLLGAAMVAAVFGRKTAIARR